MASELQLVLEGCVHTKSGHLLVIDPAYLTNFDDEYEAIGVKIGVKIGMHLEKNRESDYLKTSHGLQKVEKGLLALMKGLRERKWEGPNLDAEISEMEQQLAKSERKTALMQEESAREALVQEEPLASFLKHIPPYLIQSLSYVYAKSHLGDGSYPLVSTERGMFLIFGKHSLKPSASHSEEQALDSILQRGTLQGDCGVDSGGLIITDPSTVTIEKDVSPDNYCRIEVAPGTYLCKFEANESVLLIKAKSTEN